MSAPRGKSRSRSRRGRRYRRGAKWYNRKGLPNKSEQAVNNLGIPGLECLAGTRGKFVRLFHPAGRMDKRRRLPYLEWEEPDPERPWRKHPDFAYGWQGPDKGGTPLLVVEVFGFGKYHNVAEAHYLKREYARVGVLCLIFSSRICRRDPDAVRRRIINAIAHVEAEST